jgi:hypothetical protein
MINTISYMSWHRRAIRRVAMNAKYHNYNTPNFLHLGLINSVLPNLFNHIAALVS